MYIYLSSYYQINITAASMCVFITMISFVLNLFFLTILCLFSHNRKENNTCYIIMKLQLNENKEKVKKNRKNMNNEE